MNRISALALVPLGLSLGCAELAAAPSAQQVGPAAAAILPLRERARIEDRWLSDRLSWLVLDLMREQKVDTWVLIAREYVEDPVVATMLDSESMHARRRTILIFHDPGTGAPLERMTVSRYGLGNLFTPAWNPDQEPDQWRQVAKLLTERQPKRIAIDSSALTQFADGLTLSQYEAFMAALSPELRDRVVRNDDLAVGWLETRTEAERAFYPQIAWLTHSIIAEGLSDAAVRPGQTTADDLVWWFREKVSSLGLDTWFQPSVGIMRRGSKGVLEGDEVIRKGDIVWIDFGITYLRLNTDMQQLAYVLRDGEKDAPEGLKKGLSAANAVQDALTASFRTGLTGNQILAEARSKAVAAGLKPTIYSHPIGYHGHGAGSSIGFWDNQKDDPRGTHPLRPDTAWSIELSAKAPVPEWNGQEVDFRLEENAFFDGTRVTYLDGRQREFHLIGAR